jgi:hypothetical protein
VPESFWVDFARSCDRVRALQLIADLKPDLDAVLRAYLRRNGNYRSDALLRGAYLAAHNPAGATRWLLDLAAAAPDPTAVLADIADAEWIPLDQRAPIYRYILDSKQGAAARLQGLEKDNAQEELRAWQLRWAKYLIQTKRFAQAGDFIASLPPETKKAAADTLVPLELQVAARRGVLDALFTEYRSDSENQPSSEVLRAAARQLFAAGDKLSARKILEFVFAREIDEHKLAASNFLGLAEIRMAAGDRPGALDLLRRLVLAVGSPYENLDSAAGLLERTGHSAEAVEFLNQLVTATPWEPSYRLRLAKARIAALQNESSARDELIRIASSADAPYSIRGEAAAALAPGYRGSHLGSGELDLLAGNAGTIAPPTADQPFFYSARVSSANKAVEITAKQQLLERALADAPGREEARIPLFQAEASLHLDELALATVEPLLRQPSADSIRSGESSEEAAIIDSAEAPEQEETQPPLSSPISLSAVQRLQISRTLGDVMTRLGRLNEALPYLELARKLERDGVRQREISGKIAAVRSELRRQELNLARQPILREDLSQDRVVRPRLSALNASAAGSAGKGR